jgi:hypothetical protein
MEGAGLVEGRFEKVGLPLFPHFKDAGQKPQNLTMFLF